MKRLMKQAIHDWNNRDVAIVYIDGMVYEDAVHGICLQRYFNDKGEDEDIYLGTRPEVEQFAEVSKMYGGQDVILAHRVDRADSIYFIYGLRNGNEMSDSEIKADLSEVYPDYKIINDLEHDDNDNHGYNEEEQIDKGVQRIDDYQNDNFFKYLNDAGYKKEDNETYYNDYSMIKIDNEDKTFTVNGMLKLDYDEFIFEFYSINDVISDMKNVLYPIYTQLEKLGFELNESNLKDSENFVYSKLIGGGEIELLGGEQQFMITFYGFDKDTLQKLESIGIENDSYIDVKQLPTIIENCEKNKQANLSRLKFKNQ